MARIKLCNQTIVILLLIVASIFNHRISAASTTATELLVDDVSDGPCLPMSDVRSHLYSEFNLRSIMTSGTYYIPMGSKALYRQYAEGLLGRPAANQRELDSMQLVLKCGPLFTTIENLGFQYLENPPRFSQTCLSAGIPSFRNLGIFSGNLNMDNIQSVCIGLPAIRPNGSVALQASPSFISTTDSLIWVNDGSTVFLIYRCRADGLKDYKAVSKTKILNPSDIEIIKAKVAVLGFPEKSVAFMNYPD